MFRNSSKNLMQLPPKDQPTLSDVLAYLARLEERVKYLSDRIGRLEKKTQGDEA